MAPDDKRRRQWTDEELQALVARFTEDMVRALTPPATGGRPARPSVQLPERDVQSTLRSMREKIARLRRARGLTRYALGKLTGISRAHLGSIERGQADPTVGTLTKIAKALGVKPGALLE